MRVMKSLYQFEIISISGKETQHPCTDSFFVFVCLHCELSLVHAHIFLFTSLPLSPSFMLNVLQVVNLLEEMLLIV